MQMLSSYPVEDLMVLWVVASLPNAQMSFDKMQVEKYMMDDDEYDRCGDMVHAFKRRHCMGRFANGASEMSPDEDMKARELALSIPVGGRCEVALPNSEFRKRGMVWFVGKTEFQPGYWVGVEYDELVGKNDGLVEGTWYFQCAAGHGSFVHTDNIMVGNFPKEDLFGSNLEEM
ncbi:hypothetical protein FBU31_000042 [Coemansia sp. 'formosensis']|nr:hypothetical protein FBU31_000042 [Coemansia sp. 'formosensis']